MRARGKFRQRLSVRIAKFKEVDAVGDLVVAGHAQGHGYWRIGGSQTGLRNAGGAQQVAILPL
jgi:hypothetical protein